MNISEREIEYLLNESVVQLNSADNYQIKNNKANSLFEDYPNSYGIEAFKALLPSHIRMGKLFRISDNGQDYLKQVLMLRLYTDTAFIPLVTSTTEVINEIKLIFGNERYVKLFFNYILPRIYKYKNPYILGSRQIIKRLNKTDYTEIFKTQLSKFTVIPSFIIKNKRNTIIDISDILSKLWPNEIMLKRQNIAAIAVQLGIQIISRLVFGIIPGEQPLLDSLKTPLPPIGTVFNNIIISIPVESADIRLTNQYFNYEHQNLIPIAIKKNPKSIIILGLLHFLLKILDNNPMEENRLEQETSRLIMQKQHVVFIFHNKTHAFYIDPLEFRDKNIKYDTMFRFMKYAYKSLTALNMKIILPSDINMDNDTDPSDDEKLLDEKIESKRNIERNVINTINNTEEEKTITKELVPEVNGFYDTAKTENITKALIKGKANLMRQQSLHIADGDEDTADTADIEEDKEDEEYISDQTEYDDSEGQEEQEAKDFLDTMNDENDKESREKFIKKLTTATEPKLTKAEQKRLEVLHNKYKSIKYTNDKTLEEIIKDTNAITIDLEKSDVKIKDDSFNYMLLKDMSASYIKKTMSRDIVKTVKHFSENKSLNMHITNFKKENISDQFNRQSLYIFELEDDKKQKHKIRFKIPEIDEDGFMYINGNKKYIKKQLVLKPVTKTTEDEVYLVSDYNKCHIFRQGTVLNKNTVIVKKVIKVIQDELKANPQGELHKHIKIVRGNNRENNSSYITTIEYDELASVYHRIVLNPDRPDEVVFYFDQDNIRFDIKKYAIDYIENLEYMPIGINRKDNTVISIKTLESSDSVAGTILKYIAASNIIPNINSIIKNTKQPRRRTYSRLEIQSKKVPLVVFLASLFTFAKVIEAGGIKTAFIKNDEEAPEVLENDTGMLSIPFSDGNLYYNQYPIENSLLLNGLAEMDTQSFTYAELNELAVYLDFVYKIYKSRNLYTGWTAFKELFLNPKTVECLEALKLPTDLLELFLYANGLLADNNYTDSADASNWRLRDYEMINAALYNTIAQTYAVYTQKGKTRGGFSISDDCIINTLNNKFVLTNYDTTNPLNELRERCSVTYKGPQGINSNRAFDIKKRGQTRSTIGTIGMSSIDKGNVGIVKQLTLNPRIVSTLGFINPPVSDADIKKIPTSSLMTAEESMLPYVNHDDPKRIGFASGQTKHVIPADHFTPQIVGTGFEQSIAYKMGNDFGYKARKDGSVVAVNEKERFAVVRYDDETTERIEYGEQYNRNSDFFVENNLELNVKEGGLIKKGQLITYNKDFFKKHMGKLMYTQGVVARVVITEGEVTEDDSTAISQRLADKLTSSVIKREQMVIGINSNIIRSVEKGDHVIFGDPLLVYENQKSADSDISLLTLLGDADEKTLDAISRHRASAHYTGEIIDIKMYWSIPPENMSESCREFIKKYIRQINKQISFEEKASGVKNERKRLEIQPTKPQWDRINGMEIPKDGGIIIEYYIRHKAGKRSGDKLTLNSSLKTVICQVIPDDLAPHILSGPFKEIDMIFSFIGINARQVTSVWFNGYLGKIIYTEGKRIGKKFFEDLGEDIDSIAESSLAPLPGYNG
jgi:hypothetical protein